MTCIETASKIISHLNSRDRLSLHSSSCSEPLIVTEDVSIREIKKILDTVGHDTIKPKASYLKHSVRVARDILHYGGTSNKHLVILTCNPFALERVATENTVQMHVLCPGPLPWTYFKTSSNSGWFLLSNPSRCSLSGGTIALHDREIQKMLLQLRSARVPDHLEKVNITIIPRSQGILQDVLGATFIETMSVGESRTLLVKCDIHSERRTVSVLEHFPNGLRTTSGQLDLEREIELMLNRRQTPAIVVKVQYHHSALGPDTLCELTKDIFERDNMASPAISEMSLEQAAVQDRMLYHLATSQACPRKALAFLRSQEYENSIERSAPYLHIVLEELKYQARIQERYMLQKNQILPVLQRYSLFPASSHNIRLSAEEANSSSDILSGSYPLTPRRISTRFDQAHQTRSAGKCEESPKPCRHAQRTLSQRAQSGFKSKIKDSTWGALKSIGKSQVNNASSARKTENIAPRW